MSLTSDPTWAEHARAVLGGAGHQRGAAREAVIDTLEGQECALTAIEIEDIMRAADRRVARASVYRILDLLAHHRLVTRIEVGEGITRYERAQPDDHHHHLVCDRCGRLVPFDDAAIEDAIGRLSGRVDFAVHGHEVTLHGVCELCQ